LRRGSAFFVFAGSPRGRGGGSLDNRGRGGLGGAEIGVGKLGDAALRGLQLFLQFLVLHLQGVDGGDNLIEELINLILVVSLAELDVLELLVEDILGSEQGHCFASRSFRLDTRSPACLDDREGRPLSRHKNNNRYCHTSNIHHGVNAIYVRALMPSFITYWLIK